MTPGGRTEQPARTDAEATISTSRVGVIDIGRTVRDIALRREQPSALVALEDRHDDIVEWRMLGRRYASLKHPDHIEHVLVGGHERYIKATHYRLLAAVTGEGLLTNEGESWAHQRRLIQPLLGRRQLDHLGEHMTAAAVDHLARWDDHDDGDVIDVAAAMTELTLDVVGRALFGTTLANAADRLRPAVGLGMDTAVGAARLQSLLALPRWAVDGIGRLVLRSPVLPPSVRRIQQAMWTIDSVVREIVDARRADPQAEPSDMVGLLLGARDVDGHAMSSTQVRDELVTFMLAGHETTANALAWLWHLLAQNPEARDRLEAEIESVLGRRAPTATDAERLAWTRACVHEALRIYPPAWILEREAVADDQIADYRLRKGTTVYLPIYSVHRDERWWPDPLRFDPGRFLGEPDRARPRGAYLPFGAGRRVCVGSSFALLEATLVAASLVQRYRLDPAEVASVEPEATVTLRPKGGLPMRLSRRDYQ